MFGGGFLNGFMEDMMDPFGMFGGRRQRRNQQMQLGGPPMGGFPFGPMMPFGFPDIGGLMGQMEQSMRDPNSLNGPGFVSHSVMQMSFDGSSGQPQIYQASSTTRQGPGGVRETRQTVTDTFTGTKKMAIGHHMGGKARVIERKQDLNTREMEENEELINLDDEEKDTFEREWQQRASMGQRQGQPARGAVASGRHGHRSEMLALPAPGPSTSRPSHQRRSRGTTSSALHGSQDRRGQHVTDGSSSSYQPHHSNHVRPSSGGNRRHRREPRRHLNNQ